jgi:Ca2+-dependent lipid-binding protein
MHSDVMCCVWLCAAQGQVKVSRIANLKVTVLQAKNVPPVDSQTADPFCTLKLGSTKHQTKILKKTLQPVWNETFVFKDVRVEQDILHFKMIDHNFFKDKSMGKVDIDLRNVQITAGRTGPNDLKFEHKVGDRDGLCVG